MYAVQEEVIGVLRMLSGFAETAAFLNLGLSCVLYNLDYYNGNMIFWAIVLCTVSRPIQVTLGPCHLFHGFPLLPLSTPLIIL